jgi:transcriptional regulator with XRE-family HTH domain
LNASQIWDRILDVGQVDLDERLAARLAELRTERGWSLDELAGRSGVSRSTLSRLERGEISPTAALLGKLAPVYERTMSRLLAEVEGEPAQVVRAGDQAVWRDDGAGFTRRVVSPPHAGLRGEVIEAVLDPGADLGYEHPPVPGLEQHVWILEGDLELTDEDRVHILRTGDCLRFRLWGSTRFRNLGKDRVRYTIFTVVS